MPLINSAFGRLFLRTPRTLACFHGRNALRLRCLEPRLEPSRHCSVSCKQRERGAKPRFLSITKGQPIVQSGSQKRGMSLLRQTRLPGPAFTIKFDRDTWECFTGEALKEYLLNERHVDVTSLPVEQFSQWLAEFVIRQRKSCSIFRQREQIASLLCEPTHAEQIEKLKEELLAAQTRFKALPCYDKYVEREASIKKLDAAINGMQKFLEENADCPEYLLRKVESATTRLGQAQEERDSLSALQGLLSANHPEIKELDDAEKALEDYYVQIGLRDQEQSLSRLQQGASQGSRLNGVTFEAVSTHALRGALLCLGGQRKGDARAGTESSPLCLAKACVAGECSSPLGSILGPPDDGTFLCVRRLEPPLGVRRLGNCMILSNVTLGMGFAEIDKAIVKLKRPTPGSSDSTNAHSPAVLGEGPRTQGTGGCLSVDDILEPSDLKGRFDVVEAVALVECKRNANDLAHGFAQYQKILAWLTGDTSAYSPEDMRTNFHASGHFQKPTVHRQDDVTFTFRPSSFRRFARHERSTYFLDRLFLVAFLGPSEGSLCGIDSTAMAVLKHRLATTPALTRALEVDPPDLETVRRIQVWLAEQCKSPMSTKDMLQMYSQSELLSHHILLLSSTRG